MSHVLEIDGIQLDLGGRRILSDIYLKTETGKVTGLLGKNGHGKSCLMKIIYGSLPCEKSVRFDHVSIVEAYKRPDLLVYLPQFNFIPKSRSLRRVFQDFELEYSRFQHIFSEFAGRQNDSIGRFSGGERRLIELYIILRSPSKFAMLDEPFTHLNPLQIEKAKELIKQEKLNKGLLITDHMYNHILDVCDSLYILDQGKTNLVKHVSDIETFGYAKQ